MKIENPLISVIIPNYNHSKFLEERLDSVFNQTYQNFEVILLDDASTDKSVSILETYKNHPKRSHYVFNKTNSGNPFKQWKKGIELAKGNYIWIAESDDSCALNFLEILVEKIEPKVALVFCQSLIINANSEKEGKSNWATALDANKWESNYFNSGINEIENHLKYRNCIPNASAVVFNKLLVKKVKFPEMYYCGDWYIWLELCKLGNIAFIKDSLNYFRKHNATTREAKDFLKELNRFKEYSLIIKNNSTPTERLLNRKKYYWLIDEWLKKSRKFKFSQSIKITMPFPLYIIFIKKYITHKLKQKL